MKYSILPFTFIALFYLSSIAQSAQTLQDIETIRTRFFVGYLPDVHSSAITYSNSIDANGQWADINYIDSEIMSWDSGTHLQRLIVMSATYQTVGNSNYHSANMLLSISRGLTYYCNNAHTSQLPSWFDTCIGQQLKLQEVLILMQGAISDVLLKKGCTFLSTYRPTTFALSGQNLLWIMGQKLRRGILLNDSADIKQALDTIQMQASIKKYSGRVQNITASSHLDEGIQEDYSFFQHGSQIYNGGYGRDFLVDQLAYAFNTRATSFAFSADKLRILSDFMCQGTCMMMRKFFFDPSVMGRYISRSGNSKTSRLGTTVFDQMSTLLPTNTSTFQTLKNNVLGKGNPYSFIGNKHFWNADIMIHQRNAFYNSVRTTSARTRGTETISDENSQGYWLPFGTNFICRSSNEYIDIFPTWNWAHIPGITCPDTVPTFALTGNNGQTVTFVGGVSDGMYGLTAMAMIKLNTTAKKAWFCFDNEVVALGAGISSTETKTVNTTLNQCFLKGNVVVDGSILSGNNTFSFTSPKWVLHDSIGYVFPQASNVKLSNISQYGSWSSIGIGSTTPLVSNVFTLWVDHGISPTNATYQYIILPGVNQIGVSTFASNIPVQVISNTASLQAVRHTVSNVTQMAFYAIGSVAIPNFTIEVDQPCLLMTKVSSDTMFITASNPVWSNMTLNVKVSDAKVSKTLSFVFTNGSAGGKTQTIFLLLNNGTTLNLYPQKLPIDFHSFFAATAVGLNSNLEKAAYQTSADAIMPNQWNRTGNNFYWAGNSPTVETNTLNYSNYVDNNQGKALLLSSTVTPVIADPTVTPPVIASTARISTYSLTNSSTDYTGKAFYLSALLNFSAVTTEGFFMSFDNSWLGNYLRGKVYIKAATEGFQIGLIFGNTGTATYASTIYSYNQSHLIVLKFTPLSSGTESASLYIDPKIGSTTEPTPTVSVSDAAALKYIRAISIRQNAGNAGKIAGLRFCDNWADAVKGEGFTTVNSTKTNTINIALSGKTIIASKTGKIQVYNLQGSKILEAQAVNQLKTNLPYGLYIVRFIHDNGDLTTLKATISN